MITESVKAILGAELAAQVETALKGKGKEGKDIDIVIGNDGSYVPAEKYNGEKTASATATAALKSAAEALKAIGGSGDPAKLADDVRAAQVSVGKAQTEYEAKVKEINRRTALKIALATEAHDPGDIIPLLDLTKVEVDDAGALKTDLTPMLQSIKATKPYLFKTQPTGAGAGAGAGAAAGAAGTIIVGAGPVGGSGRAPQGYEPTMEEVAKMSPDQYREWRKTH